MNKFLAKVVSVTITSLIILAYLFDPTTSVSLGTSIFPTTPNVVLTLAEVVGNLVWILGIIAMFAIVVFSYNLVSDEAMASAAKREKDLPPVLQSTDPTILSHIAMVGAVIMSLIGIGSGFWFTGTMYLLCTPLSFSHRKALMKEVHKQAEHNQK